MVMVLPGLSGDDLVLAMDADSQVHDGWIATAADALMSDQTVGACCGVFVGVERAGDSSVRFSATSTAEGNVELDASGPAGPSAGAIRPGAARSAGGSSRPGPAGPVPRRAGCQAARVGSRHAGRGATGAAGRVSRGCGSPRPRAWSSSAAPGRGARGPRGCW